MIKGERLSELRKDKGMLQKDVASYIGVCTKSISLYEQERVAPPDDIKIKLAELFNVSVDYLLGVTDVVSYKPSNKYIVLPKNSPIGLKREVEEYIEFLICKHQKNANIKID